MEAERSCTHYYPVISKHVTLETQLECNTNTTDMHQMYTTINTYNNYCRQVFSATPWRWLAVAPIFSPSTVSSSKCKTTAMYLAMIILVMTSPLCANGLRDDDIPAHSRATAASVSCFRHFSRRVQGCLDPFTSLLDLYDIDLESLAESQASSKHICLEYEVVLLCLHSALTDCPALRNLRIVQNKLNPHWVCRVNNFCGIQSKPSRQKDDRQDTDRNPQAGSHPEYTTNEIDSDPTDHRRKVQKSTNRRTELMKNIIDTNTEHPIRHFSSLRRELERSLDNTDNSEVKLNIVNVVQNFNYPMPSELKKDMERIMHSSHTMLSNSVSRNIPHLKLWILAFNIIILVHFGINAA